MCPTKDRILYPSLKKERLHLEKLIPSITESFANKLLTKGNMFQVNYKKLEKEC
jgi:hypothetical protein